jgi:hypothetical protein
VVAGEGLAAPDALLEEGLKTEWIMHGLCLAVGGCFP